MLWLLCTQQGIKWWSYGPGFNFLTLNTYKPETNKWVMGIHNLLFLISIMPVGKTAPRCHQQNSEIKSTFNEGSTKQSSIPLEGSHPGECQREKHRSISGKKSFTIGKSQDTCLKWYFIQLTASGLELGLEKFNNPCLI